MMEPIPRFEARAFAAAALDPGQLPPAGIADGDRGGRFAVYRNNVLGGLVRALEARFPVVRRLVGETFFAPMAAAFAARHPPRSPLMLDYGAGFDAFVAAFPPAVGLPYLADVAALELARGRAYHAVDATPLGAEAFARLAARHLVGLRLVLHPSLSVLRSRHPLVAIWAAHQGAAPPTPIVDWHAEDALVYRAGEVVATLALPPGEAAFLGAIHRLATLADAAADALAETPDFDAGAVLARLIGEGLIVSLQQDMETET